MTRYNGVDVSQKMTASYRVDIAGSVVRFASAIYTFFSYCLTLRVARHDRAARLCADSDPARAVSYKR